MNTILKAVISTAFLLAIGGMMALVYLHGLGEL